MRLGFFLKEALRALRRSAAPSLAATLTILLTAVVLGVFIPIVQATTGTANEVRSRVVVDVYLDEAAQPGEIAELRTTLDEFPNVADVEFISKEQALEREAERNPEAYELLGSNPLPDAYRITPEDPDGVTALVEGLQPEDEEAEDDAAEDDAATGEEAAAAEEEEAEAGAGGGGDRDGDGGGASREPPAETTPDAETAADAEAVSADPLAAIDEVRNREEETDKILSATGLVKLVVAVLAGLLIVASIALVANTIRLSVFARRREIEVMRLVGATNWFIRWPFVIEGLIVGLIGGLAAIGLLYVAKISFVDPISERLALLAAPDTIDFPLLVAVLLGACMAVAAIGSGLTLRRFLRV